MQEVQKLEFEQVAHPAKQLMQLPEVSLYWALKQSIKHNPLVTFWLYPLIQPEQEVLLVHPVQPVGQFVQTVVLTSLYLAPEQGG